MAVQWPNQSSKLRAKIGNMISGLSADRVSFLSLTTDTCYQKFKTIFHRGESVDCLKAMPSGSSLHEILKQNIEVDCHSLPKDLPVED